MCFWSDFYVLLSAYASWRSFMVHIRLTTFMHSEQLLSNAYNAGLVRVKLCLTRAQGVVLWPNYVMG